MKVISNLITDFVRAQERSIAWLRPRVHAQILEWLRQDEGTTGDLLCQGCRRSGSAMPHVGPQIRLCNGANGSPVMPAQAARSRRTSPEPPTSLMPETFPFFLMRSRAEE